MIHVNNSMASANSTGIARHPDSLDIIPRSAYGGRQRANRIAAKGPKNRLSGNPQISRIYRSRKRSIKVVSITNQTKKHMKIMSSAKILQKAPVLVAIVLAFNSGSLSAWETDDEPGKKEVEITDAVASPATKDYLVNPGDVIAISVWREADLRADVLVRPDGKFSFPLAGDIQAEGNSVDQIRQQVTEKLNRYIPDPVVSVSVLQINGNKIYVIGQVNRPGDINANPQLDVLQALSLAGGTTPFAQANDISILRRTENGIVSIPFRYGDIEKGKRLEQNIMLQAGDVVVVP